METQTLTVGNYFKANIIIHVAMVMGLVFFLLVSFLLQKNSFGTIGGNLSKSAVYITPIIALIGLFGSASLFKRKLNGCRTKQHLNEKLTEYRSALILKFAIIEGTTFILIIFYFLTGEFIILSAAGLLIIVFTTYIPTKAKLINDLALSFTDRQILDDPNTEIK